MKTVKDEAGLQELRDWEWGPWPKLTGPRVWFAVWLSYAVGIVAFILFLGVAVLEYGLVGTGILFLIFILFVGVLGYGVTQTDH